MNVTTVYFKAYLSITLLMTVSVALSSAPTQSNRFLSKKSLSPTIILTDPNPRWISGQYSYSTHLNKEDVAKEFIYNVIVGSSKNAFAGSSPLNLKTTRKRTDLLNQNSIINIQQYNKDIPIFGSDIAIHITPKNEVKVSAGKIHNFSSISTTPTVLKSTALATSLADLNQSNHAVIKNELTIYIKNDSPFLSWHHIIETHNNHGIAIERWNYFIDANKGHILSKFNEIHSFNKRWNTYQCSTVQQIPGQLMLTNTQTTTNIILQNLHNHTSDTLDYFKNTFNRHSYDNNSKTVESVFLDFRYENALWTGKYLIYGKGDGIRTNSFATLDVVAHEFGHAVTSETSKLIYEGQSGALNEAMSDIYGVMVDRNDWLLGEDIYLHSPGKALRYFADPTLGNQPKHMNNFVLTTDDNGGVHINSGIINHAFYLFATATSKEIAEQIFHRAHTVYFTQSTNFIEARYALEQSAIDLHGKGSTPHKQIAAAFDAVGIRLSEDIYDTNYNWTFVAQPNQTPHPYPNNYSQTITINHTNADAIKVHFSVFQTEMNFDVVYLKDKFNQIHQRYSGILGSFVSGPVSGNTLIIDFLSDKDIQFTGFKISGYLYGIKKPMPPVTPQIKHITQSSTTPNLFTITLEHPNFSNLPPNAALQIDILNAQTNQVVSTLTFNRSELKPSMIIDITKQNSPSLTSAWSQASSTYYLNVQFIHELGTSRITYTPPVNIVLPLPSTPQNIPLTVSSVINGPNPFNPFVGVTTFQYTLSTPADIHIEIYSLFGHKVFETRLNKGLPGSSKGLNKSITWNGRNSRGQIVANGVYIAYIKISSYTGTIKRKCKVVVLK